MAKTSSAKTAPAKKAKASAAGKTKNDGTQSNLVPAGKDNSLLHEFFVDSLKDIYWAEKALTKALTKLQKKATNEELKNAFAEHQTQTQEHASRLEKAFEMAGKKAQAKKCEAMDGIIKESESIIEETKDDTFTRDAALIMAAQKAEHYEIATYGGIVTIAKTLGHNDIADLLYQTLEEEKETDQKLTQIAESNINEEASEEEGDGEEE